MRVGDYITHEPSHEHGTKHQFVSEHANPLLSHWEEKDNGDIARALFSKDRFSKPEEDEEELQNHIKAAQDFYKEFWKKHG